jgi:hypothetical protein
MSEAYREMAEVPCTCDQLVPNPCITCWLDRHSGPCRTPGAHICRKHMLVSCNNCGRLVAPISNVSSDGVCRHTDADGPHYKTGGPKPKRSWEKKVDNEDMDTRPFRRLRYWAVVGVVIAAASIIVEVMSHH